MSHDNKIRVNYGAEEYNVNSKRCKACASLCYTFYVTIINLFPE